MARYLITHSILSSWLYTMKSNPNEDSTTERDPYEEFVLALQRKPTPVTDAMQDGMEFEDLVTKIAYGYKPDEKPRWYDAAAEVAGIVRGGQFQFKAKKTVSAGGYDFLMYGRLDALKAGHIYDIKFSKGYDRGKYYTSTQHPIYLDLIPEALDFTYLVSNGTDVWTERYVRDEAKDIRPMLAEFVDWLKVKGLFQIYEEYWATK